MANGLNIAIVAMLYCMNMSVHHGNLANNSKKVLSKQAHIIQKIEKQNPQLSHAAFMAGVRAYDHLCVQGHDRKQLLTIVNFNKHSNIKRLWVIDMRDGRVIYNTFVAHGKNSGGHVAKYFSNVSGSHQSSIGVYVTGHSYYGVDGYSMRLQGLDKGFNNNAYKRHIVMHPAKYATPDFIRRHGYAGHTLGCFGVNKKLAKKIIQAIQHDTVMVAYYPNKTWLTHSVYEQPLKDPCHVKK